MVTGIAVGRLSAKHPHTEPLLEIATFFSI